VVPPSRNLWKSVGIIIPSDFLISSCLKKNLEKVEITISEYNQFHHEYHNYNHSIMNFQAGKRFQTPKFGCSIDEDLEIENAPIVSYVAANNSNKYGVWK